jgi:DNA-binding winged helix-turn-helix (wHTH) protein/tetratricopeptide (TPR) repeat protein
MSLGIKAVFHFGLFRLDAGERSLDRRGVAIPLAPKVFDLLVFLLQNPGKLLPKAAILEAVWNGIHVDESGLTRAISDLRRALGQTAEESWIETVPKFGYRFCGEVQVEGPIAAAATPATAPAGMPRRLRWTGRAAAAPAGVLVALGLLSAAGWSLWRGFHHLTPLPSGSGWVLVANFENRSGQRLFDGTVEYAMERELSNSQFLRVVPRERVEDALRLMKRPPASNVDVKLGRELCLRDGEIQALVAGRVEKLGTTYVLSAEVLNPANGARLASLSEEDSADTHLAAVIRRLCSRVREAIGEDPRLIQQSNERLEKVTTPSLHALHLYTQADRVVARGRDGDLQAVELLEQALKEDPDFASAQNLLGHGYANLRQNEEALPHFQRAFELADTTPDREKLFILASYYSRAVNEPEKAAAVYEALLRLYPDHYWAHNNLAGYYTRLGRLHDAGEQWVQLADLRPNDLHANAQAARFLLLEAGWETADFSPTTREIRNRAQAYTARGLKLLQVDAASPSHASDANNLRLTVFQQDWLAGDVSKTHADLLWILRENKPLEPSIPVSLLLALGELHEAEGRAAGDNLALAEIAFYRGDLSKARELLRAKLPEDPVGFDFAACLMMRLGMLPEAERMYQKLRIAYRTRSGPPRVVVVEGQLALARGETAKGIVLLERALPQYEGSSATSLGYGALADAYRKQGKRSDAVRVLERESGVYGVGNHAEAFRLRLRLQLADLYRELGRISDAQRIEGGLRKELAFADSDHPILLALARRGG